MADFRVLNYYRSGIQRRTEEKKLDKNKGDYTLQANLKDSLLELWLNRLTKRQQDDSFYPQRP